MRAALTAILLMGLAMAGCKSDSDADLNPVNPQSGNGAPTTPPANTGFRPLFQPLQGIFPYPNDLYFNGSTDGTLNLPLNPFQSTAAQLNTLDGFSTSSYISTRFSAAVDPATLTASTVRVIRLTINSANKAPLLPPASGAQAPVLLTFGTDYTVSISTEPGSGGGTVIIRPTRPLDPSTGATNIGYLVMFTNGVRSTGNVAATPDNDYATIRTQALTELGAGATTPSCTPITNTTLRSLCQLTFAHLAIASQTGTPPANVVMSFTFSTQSTRDTLGVLAQTIGAAPAGAIAAVPIQVQGVTLTTTAVSSALQGKANLYAGTVRVPYYLTVANANCNAAATLASCPPIRSFWTAAGAPPSPLDQTSRNLTRFNPVPLKTADLDIPLFVTVPNANSGSGGVRPTNGWPVVIFQHGLTRNRVDAVAVADAFADAGFVVVSIDLPLHGISTTSTAAAFRMAGLERTFDLDVSNNTTLAPAPDGTVDGSGQNFVNLVSVLTTRDNLRQGAVDLLALTRALPNLELTGDSTPDVDPDRIHFIGHSLGGIVGGVYAGLSANPRTASLLMAGGGVAQTIVDSPAFGPAVIANLAAQGATQGSTLFNQFLRDAQTAVDPGDPVNYIRTLLAAKPVHMTQVVGGGSPGWPSDLVVPNSSTQRLIDTGTLPTVLIRRVSTGVNAVSAGNAGYVNFLFGHHGSIIDPTCSGLPAGSSALSCGATTVEMQTQVVNFAFSNGAAIVVTNPAVVQQ